MGVALSNIETNYVSKCYLLCCLYLIKMPNFPNLSIINF